MPRPVWNGAISFGLLNVPVQLFTAERTVDLHFRMLDARDKKPIRYERVNADTGEEVPWKDVVKAYEYSKGSYVVVDEKTLRKAAPEATETVDIEAFVDAASIDPMYFHKPYYLTPGKKAEKGYVLLRETLRRSGKIAIARVVIRTRQYLAAVMPNGDALILNLLRFPQELVPAREFSFPSGALTRYRLNATELRMAEQLLETMTRKWNPSEYKDDFRDQLRKLLHARAGKNKDNIKLEEEDEKASEKTAPNVVDFMALLKQSLAKKPPAPRARKGSTAKRTSRKRA